MIEDTKLRIGFQAYFYCLILSDFKEKYTITHLDAFNVTERKLYQVYYDKFQNEQLIDRITIAYEMNIADCSSYYNMIMQKGDSNKWNPDHISEYYNNILREYRINLFQSAKTPQEIEKAIIKHDELNETTDIAFYDVEYALNSLLNESALKPLTTKLKLFDEKIMLAGGLVGLVGKSGCFYKDQLIHTSNGVKPISEIKINDIVLSYNHNTKINEYRKVLEVFKYPTHKDKMYKIKLKDGTIIKVTENHEFFDGKSYVKIKDLLLSLQ